MGGGVWLGLRVSVHVAKGAKLLSGLIVLSTLNKVLGL